MAECGPSGRVQARKRPREILSAAFCFFALLNVDPFTSFLPALLLSLHSGMQSLLDVTQQL
jgi:hypothetical protein